MEDKELQEFIQAFETKYKTVWGWIFVYAHPGFFEYYKGPYSVFFTPEHAGKGIVDIQIFYEAMEYKAIPGYDVPLVPRTPEGLYEIVKKFLTAIDTQPSVLDWEPE